MRDAHVSRRFVEVFSSHATDKLSESSGNITPDTGLVFCRQKITVFGLPIPILSGRARNSLLVVNFDTD